MVVTSSLRSTPLYSSPRLETTIELIDPSLPKISWARSRRTRRLASSPARPPPPTTPLTWKDTCSPRIIETTSSPGTTSNSSAAFSLMNASPGPRSSTLTSSPFSRKNPPKPSRYSGATPAMRIRPSLREVRGLKVGAISPIPGAKPSISSISANSSRNRSNRSMGR